jgi:hypothetical protein
MKTHHAAINATFGMHLSHVLRHVHEAIYSTDREPAEIRHHEKRPGFPKLNGSHDSSTQLLQELRGRLRELDSDAALERRVLHVAEAAPKAPVVRLPSVLREEVAEAAAHTRWHLEILSTAVEGVNAAVMAAGGIPALVPPRRREPRGGETGSPMEDPSDAGDTRSGPLLEFGALILEQTMTVLSQAPWETQHAPAGQSKREALMRAVARVWGSFVGWSRQCEEQGQQHFTQSRQDALTAGTHHQIGQDTTDHLDQGAMALRGGSQNPSPRCARLIWEAAFEALHRAYQLRVAAAAQGIPAPLAMGMAPGTCARNPAACGLL